MEKYSSRIEAMVWLCVPLKDKDGFPQTPKTRRHLGLHGLENAPRRAALPANQQLLAVMQQLIYQTHLH